MAWTETNRPKYERKSDRHQSDLTDAEWALLSNLFSGAPRKWPLCEVVNAIPYMLRSGGQWRMSRKSFPPKSAVCCWFAKWRDDGASPAAIHLIANAHGLPTKAEISDGEVSDYKGFDLLRVDPLPAAKVFIAAKGYDSNHIRDAVTAEGGTPVIPARANRKTPEPFDRITYALRNHVERCCNKMKCSRRLATRYDKTAASYLGFVQIVAARLWVRSLSS